MAGYGSQLRGQSKSNDPVLLGSSSDETTPLFSKEPRRRIFRDGLKLIIYGILAFSVANLYLHFTNCPLYPGTMDAIRRDWQQEVARHDIIREEWGLEKREHNQVIEERNRQEEERRNSIREEWRLEQREHNKVIKERNRQEEERHNSIREEWRLEQREHNKVIEERNRQEEEERQKLNMFWGNIEKAHMCIRYGTREYTAQLMNLPTTWEHRVEACKATAIEIHGNAYLPKSCEDKGPGVVIGRWEVDQHEPDCASFWIWYKDKGCTSSGSGKRRIEHYLENLPIGGDWREFCATTPAQFHGKEFKGAEECFQSKGGTWGYWEIDDASCL